MAEQSRGTRPWCPFCGATIKRPREAVQRRMNEFPGGRCACGAVYVADATGHNVGAAMVECLVAACGDDWDLAWELIPEDDYLTGRLDDYDEQTHQIIDTRNIDGRAVRGVLYFVRLHRDVAEVAERARKKQQALAASQGQASIPQPQRKSGAARDTGRPKQRATKTKVRQMAAEQDLEGLVTLALDDKRTLRFLQRLLYQREGIERYRLAWLIGQVCGRLATPEPGVVADLLHRLFEACVDSAATPWGLVETIGAVIAIRPDIFGAFTRHLLNFMGDTSMQEGVLWGLGEIACRRPDLIRNTPFYATFHFLGHEQAMIRGLMVRLLGRIQAREALFQIMSLQQDDSPLTLLDQGQVRQSAVGELAAEAVALIQQDKTNTSQDEGEDV